MTHDLPFAASSGRKAAHSRMHSIDQTSTAILARVGYSIVSAAIFPARSRNS